MKWWSSCSRCHGIGSVLTPWGEETCSKCGGSGEQVWDDGKEEETGNER